MRRKEERRFSFSVILFITFLMSTLVFADIDPNGPYGIAPEQITNYNTNSINSEVGVIMPAGTSSASTALAYGSYIFTTEDIVLFSYEDGTQLEVYDSSGNPVSLESNVLDKGEHVFVDTTQGIYLVAGSNKFAVLTGDATTNGVSGYYAMDADGRGASEEFYTYVPALQTTVTGHSEFIVFAYEDDTTVTIQEQEVSGDVYTDIATVTLNQGEHWANASISDKYLHIIADKPVSALTCHDQSYFVPSADGRWSGTEFYTYVSDIGDSGGVWPEDLTVIAYDDDTLVSIKDSDTQETICTLDSGQAYVKSHVDVENKYFTITTSSPVTVSVQPWESCTSSYFQGVFIPDRYGTGIGTDLIGSTLDGGYLWIVAHTDNTHIDLYDSQTEVWQASYTLDTGQTVDANPGNGLWRIISDKAVSAYSGWYIPDADKAIAHFAPLVFNKSPIILKKVDDVEEEGDCSSPLSTIVYEISWKNPGDKTVEDVNLVDFLPKGVNFEDFVEGVVYQPVTLPPADPNIVFAITDANGLDDITLPVGQSVRLYLTKETFEEDVVSFYLEAMISDPNLGWIDNMEYDPNNPGTAEILAQPRASFFDYYGPGSTQPEGIQFFAASFAGPMEDGNLASFVYTATEPGYVVLTLVNYGTSAILEEIVIRQTDPNDPNYVPQEPEESEETPVFSASSVLGVNDEQAHTITWQLGDIAPGGYGSVSFSVTVNYKAEPGMFLHNVAKMISQDRVIARAPENTRVCCWDTTDPNIIFVDKNANGNNNGTSWTDAYTDLQDALYRAGNSTCQDVNMIYVAQGEYSPGTRVVDSFVLPDGVSVYGGFAGWETSPDQRQIQTHPTILTGRIDPNNRNETIMVMGDETLLDGVIVQDSGFGQGVLCEDVSCDIVNCTMKNNISYGIYADNSNVKLKWCRIENNGWDGLRHIGNGKSITIENCQVNSNRQHGIYLVDSISIVKNNVICDNGIEDAGYFVGVWFENPKAIAAVHNNTMAYNRNEAVYYLDEDPNHVNIPDIQNCIIWYNNQQGSTEQFAGWKVPTQYSCVYDPNDQDGVSETIDGNHNFSHKPDFAYPYSDDPNVFINVHLATEPYSFCKDKGSPGSYADQNDIDGEARVADDYVDVGADEINCYDVYNPLDWNADGLVNLYEFNFFARAWLSRDPNDPTLPSDPNQVDPNEFINWDSRCDLNQNYRVDLPDIIIFMDDWLWVACWRHDIEEYLQAAASSQQQMMMSTSTFLESEEVSESVETVSVMPVRMIPPASDVQPVETVTAEETVEAVETDPAAQREQALSLLEDIDALIDAGGEDAEAWLEIKNLLEQTLVDMEDTVNDPNEI